jgi:hypothetical protein
MERTRFQSLDDFEQAVKLCEWMSGVAQLGQPPVSYQRRPNKASAGCGSGGIWLSNATRGLGGDQERRARPKTFQDARLRSGCRPLST